MSMLANLHSSIEELCKGLEHIVIVQDNILKSLKELVKCLTKE